MVVGHGAALSTPEYFDVADCLNKRIAQQEALGTADEPDDINPESGEEEDDPLPFWINPNPSPPPPPPPRPRRPHDTPPTAMDFKKEGSKRRRARKRAEVQERNGTPGIKAIHLKRRDEALGTTIQVGVDIDDLPHSKPAWIGNRNAQEDHTFEDGMGGRIYTDDEIWELTGERGMRYINWLGVYVLFFAPFFSSSFSSSTRQTLDPHHRLAWTHHRRSRGYASRCRGVANHHRPRGYPHGDQSNTAPAH